MIAIEHARAPAATQPGIPRVFARVLVGVDRSAESREAGRQAAQLMGRAGYLELLAAYEVAHPAAVSGVVVEDHVDDQVRRAQVRATSALERACIASGRDDIVAKVLMGRPIDALLEEARQQHATLIAVGSHGHARAAGIVLGSVATETIHRAPCSVLVARGRLPQRLRRVVVGIDGSPESVSAYDVAAELAERTGAELWPVAAHGEELVDRDAIDALTRRREDSPNEPVRALVAAAADADLLVVGSRGLHGLKALGSVSERVSHEARCSTLIVRRAPS
jgi:nucleotide-binding universal stress UspA family protein